MYRPIILLVFAAAASLFSAGPGYAVQGGLLWDAVYSANPGADSCRAAGVAVDSQGNVIVAGTVAGRDGNNDFLTVKYGPDGATLWTRRFDKTWHDSAAAVAVDTAGNVYVAGSVLDLARPSSYFLGSYFTDYLVVKYSPDGTPTGVMTSSGAGKGNEPAGIVVDADGAVYVTGAAKNATDTYYVFYTVKFDVNGDIVWERMLDWGGDSFATGLALDPGGSVIAGGYTKGPDGYFSVRAARYTPDGAETALDISIPNQTDNDKAWAVSVGDDGNFVLTGESSAENGITVTAKFSPDGVRLWTARYDRSEFPNKGAAVSLDQQGRVYVVGRTFKPNQDGDFTLLVYSKDGVLVDDKTYPFGGESGAAGVALDSDGNLLVTGFTRLLDEPSVFRTVRLSGYAVQPGASGPDDAAPISMTLEMTGLADAPEPLDPRLASRPDRLGLPEALTPPPAPSGLLDALGLTGYPFLAAARGNAHHWELLRDCAYRGCIVTKPRARQADTVRAMVDSSSTRYTALPAIEIQ